MWGICRGGGVAAGIFANGMQNELQLAADEDVVVGGSAVGQDDCNFFSNDWRCTSIPPGEQKGFKTT